MKKLAIVLLALLLCLPSVSTATEAVLNQRMATRSGPSTLYTEELGTLPQSTPIRVIEQVMGSVPWGLVEFEKKGFWYRAYTGMKRINAYSEVPWGIQDGTPSTMLQEVQVYYGPSTYYAPRRERLSVGTPVLIVGGENDYLMVEYAWGEKLVRGYVPMTSVAMVPYSGMFQPPTKAPAPAGGNLTATISLSNQHPAPGEELTVEFHIQGGKPPYDYFYIWDMDINHTGDGTGNYAQTRYLVRQSMFPEQRIYLHVTDSASNHLQEGAVFYPQNGQMEEVLLSSPLKVINRGDTAQVMAQAQYSPNVYSGYLWFDYFWVFEEAGGKKTETLPLSSGQQWQQTFTYKTAVPGKLWLVARVYDSGDGHQDYYSPMITIQ